MTCEELCESILDGMETLERNNMKPEAIRLSKSAFDILADGKKIDRSKKPMIFGMEVIVVPV